MKSYLSIAPKYLEVHKRKTLLTVLSVVMAVALVTSVFSMLDALVKFEKAQVLKDDGDYHILIRNPTEKEINYIGNRGDVINTGSLKYFGDGSIDGEKCALAALDENFAKNLNFELAEGSYPTGDNEIMLERWFMDKFKPALKIGDTVKITLPDRKSEDVVISGIYKDLGATKAAGIPGVFLSVKGSVLIVPETHDYLIKLKDGVNIIKAENEISKSLNLNPDRLARNERLLALMLQSKNSRVKDMYGLGAILFCLVIVTGVVMIYNTFNISVLERVRYFGLLRCIGASPTQIRRLVRREGFLISLKAVPIGLLAGMFMTFICSIILRFFNTTLFGSIPLFSLSILGTSFGIMTGFLTVYIASVLPAKKAAKVSPVNALTGNNEMKTSKTTKRGLLIKMFNVEIAMGIGSSVKKKKTLFLMTCSIAFSITIFLGFNFLVNPEYMGMKAIKSYTADISLTSNKGMNSDLYKKLLGTKGIKRVYGRMTSYVSACFDEVRLNNTYKNEKSWLISYDKTQLNWAREYLKAGETDEDKLNTQNGIIAVEKSRKKNALKETSKLRLGDKVYIETNAGKKEFTVMGVCDSIPYGSEDMTMNAFITTERLFTEITGDSSYKMVDIQLNSRDGEQVVNEIKDMAGNGAEVLDKRQLNSQARNSFLTMAVFIYGFVAVIALISILNIVNTMNTSLVSKIKYMGVMRAVGMSGAQLTRMVFAEAFIYIISGCLAGCFFGVTLREALNDFLLGEWKFPLIQIILIFVVAMLAAVFSIIHPLKKIKGMDISEVITSLR